MATTSKISLSNIPSSTFIESITDGFQRIAFSSNMRKLEPDSINNWGVPPYTEGETNRRSCLQDSISFLWLWNYQDLLRSLDLNL